MSCVSHSFEQDCNTDEEIILSRARGQGSEAGAAGGGGEDSEAGLRGQRLPRPQDSLGQG